LKINQVLIENFKPFRSVYLPLEGELPNGLFIVQGPNSSGKTSLVEAILWGLWGPRAIKWMKQEQLIRKTESSCEVTLDFEVEGAKYRIKRGLTRGSGVTVVLFKGVNGKYVPLERNVAPVEKQLDEILGISYQEALETLFVRQGEVDKLAVATPGELRDLVRDLFGLERLEQITEVLREKAKELDEEIRSLEKQLAVLPEKQRQKKSLKKELKELKARFSKLSKLINELEKELKKTPPTQTLNKLKDLDSKIQKITTDKQTQEEQLKRAKKEKTAAAKSITKLNSELTKLDKERSAVAKEKKELEATKTKIDKKESRLKLEETRLEKIQDDLQNAHGLLKEIEAAEAEIKKTNQKLAEKAPLEKKKAAVTKKRKALVREYVAPENIAAQIESVKKDITKRERRITLLKKKKSQLGTLSEEVETLPQIEGKWESQNKLYLNTRDTITKINTELEHLETATQSVMEYKGGECPTCLQEIKPEYAENLTEKLKQQITQGKADLSKKKTLLKRLTKSVKELQTERDKLKTSATKIEALKADVQELQEQLEELEQLNTKMKTLVAQLKTVKETSRKIEECDSKLKEIETALLQLADLQGRLRQLEKQAKRRGKIQKKIETLTPKEVKHNKKCQQLKQALQELTEKFDEKHLQELTEHLTEMEANIKTSQKKRDQLVGGLEKLEDHIQNLNKNLQGLKKDLKANRKDLDTTLQTLKAESVENFLKTFKKKSLDELILHRTRQETELDGKKDNLKNLNEQVEDKKGQQKKITEEIEGLHKKEEDLRKKKKQHTHMEQLRILVDDFVSEHVVRNKLCGALKTATTEYLTRFSTGRYSLLDIDAPTKGPYGAGVIITLKDHMDQLEKSRELLSGGDRASLGLALRMAISRLIARIRPFKSGQLKRTKVRCLIMDEPLGSLDSERRPEVVHTLMDDKAFTQIFLITHTDLLLTEEEAAAAHQIKVYQEGGVSKLTFQPATLKTLAQQ
jgi:exonuclease SbcC